MILKLASGNITEMIEIGQIRVEHKQFTNYNDAIKWEKRIGNHSAFGVGASDLKGSRQDSKIIDAYYIGCSKPKSQSWEHIIAYNCGIFLMDESGKTIEVISR